jgi:hypothetical protein
MTEVQRLWGNEFGTPPPIYVRAAKLCDKFEEDRMAQDVSKGPSVRPCRLADHVNGMTELHTFTQSLRMF